MIEKQVANMCSR